MRVEHRLPGNTNFSGYAGHVGFFDFIGSPFGKDLGEARGNSRYFPIEVWNIPDFKETAGEYPLGELVDRRSSDLAGILLQETSGDVFDVLQYAIREISRNAVEHSKGENAAILAQYWPTTGIAEVAVIDDGVGIAENLYDNEFIDISNSTAALKAALLPGITGVSRAERVEQHERWHNSGFGLYIVSRLAAKYGQFRVISSGDYLELHRNSQFHHSYPMQGTAVGIRLDVKQLDRAKQFIARTISDGEAMQSEILKDFPIAASAASKLFSSQFRVKLGD